MNHSLLGRSEHSLIIELRFISNIRQFAIKFHWKNGTVHQLTIESRVETAF